VPEGDTIHRAARTLARAIGDKTITKLTCDAGGEDLVGHTITSVEAHGKHLLMRFDDGRTLHTHMQMDGSWHIYRPGEKWRRPSFAARVVIETADWLAVCFDAPLVELVHGTPELVRSLGPDLLGDTFDMDAAISRVRAVDLPIGEAIMRQQLVAGIGNVYKSELLFLERLDPFVRVTDEEILRAVLARARALMLQNMSGNARTTRRRLTGSRVWVYGRSGKPCFTCGARIRMRRQGDAGRSTYYCPQCQRVSP
jgi:endonuclease-8